MKKILSIISLAVLTTGLLSSCKKDDSPIFVTGVTLDKASLVMIVGDADVRLTATVNPENATDKTISWSSDKSEVVTVNQDGSLHAVAKGEATITVTTKDGGKTATCAVTVKEIATIADVLATVEGGFPTSTAQNIVPDNAWRSGTNHFAYVFSTALFLKQPTDEDGSKAGQAPVLLDYPVTKEGNSYTYSHTIFNLTFNMEDGMLDSIEITNSTGNTKHNGIYVPAASE